MKNITPSDQQAAAIRAIVDWWRDPNGKQVFYLAGYAGTGKSTVYAFVLEELEKYDCHEVVTCAFTGKAANVLRQKGTPDAMTIHGAIYTPVEDKKTGQTKFVKNLFGAAAGADLIGLDECSMVDDWMAEDLLSFKKRILVMGDPGQLPPIRGPGAFVRGEPDVFLTEIHRQAAESPIIRLATMARKGERIPVGEYGDAVRVLMLDRETQHEVYRDDTMALCGIHKTRFTITQRYRARLGREGPNPLPGEPVICCRNDKELGIFNGGLGEVIKAKRTLSEILRIDVAMEDLKSPLYEVLVDPYLFDGHFKQTERRKDFRGLKEFDWAYVLTCHKAQGSEWPHVTVVDDSGAFRDNRDRWLYTAITRAAEGLTLLKRS